MAREGRRDRAGERHARSSDGGLRRRGGDAGGLLLVHSIAQHAECVEPLDPHAERPFDHGARDRTERLRCDRHLTRAAIDRSVIGLEGHAVDARERLEADPVCEALAHEPKHLELHVDKSGDALIAE